LGIIFVGLNIMSGPEAFGNALVKNMFTGIFAAIDFPLLLIVVGIIFTALIQSSSAATGIVITMVGAGVMELDLALFIVMGANIGTCVTALLASLGGTTNGKRVALIHCTNNTIGVIFFAIITWLFRDQVVGILSSVFPGSDPMSLQMRVSLFHVIFNVTTTALLLPFVKQLVQFAETVIRDKAAEKKTRTLRFVDSHLLAMPTAAMLQVQKEIDYMIGLAEENTRLSMLALQTGNNENADRINENEEIINFTNKSLTGFLIQLASAQISAHDEATIGAYFHVLNDLERIGDHAVNFYEIGVEMAGKKLSFSEKALSDIGTMGNQVMQMFTIAKETFENVNKDRLPALADLEEGVDGMKRELIASHFTRLAEGNCSVDVSPYYSSVVVGLERVADHLVNVGYSIVNPTGSQSE
jgi:phosphate:Na+ symporter